MVQISDFLSKKIQGDLAPLSPNASTEKFHLKPAVLVMHNVRGAVLLKLEILLMVMIYFQQLHFLLKVKFHSIFPIAALLSLLECYRDDKNLTRNGKR